MIRTQVYLPKDIYEQIKAGAHREGKSFAEKIRESLQKGMDDSSTVTEAKTEGVHYLEKLSQLQFSGGPDDGSINHDKYIYEI